MTTDNTSNPLNPLALLSQEMERTLRLRAWRDGNFREALIADPKGVVQGVFPHCFPDGKVPDGLIIKVIEEDPFTHHIVLPPLPDEFVTSIKTNTSDFLNPFAPLRGEVEKTLRLRAWEDETFHQQMIADSKGVVEQLFPQCFPDGKASKQLTY